MGQYIIYHVFYFPWQRKNEFIKKDSGYLEKQGW